MQIRKKICKEQEKDQHGFTLLKSSIGGLCWTLFSVWKLNSCTNWSKMWYRHIFLSRFSMLLRGEKTSKPTHHWHCGFLLSVPENTNISFTWKNLHRHFTVGSAANKKNNSGKKGRTYFIQITEWKWSIVIEIHLFIASFKDQNT